MKLVDEFANIKQLKYIELEYCYRKCRAATLKLAQEMKFLYDYVAVREMSQLPTITLVAIRTKERKGKILGKETMKKGNYMHVSPIIKEKKRILLKEKNA